MHKHVRLISPVVAATRRDPEMLRSLERPELTISRVKISRGPASIESAFDDMLAVPDTVAKIIEAERDGVHAAVIDCMGDPGLHAKRLRSPCSDRPRRRCMWPPCSATASASSPCSIAAGRCWRTKPRFLAWTRSLPRCGPSNCRYSSSRPTPVDCTDCSSSRRRRRSPRTAPTPSSSVAPACSAGPKPCGRDCWPPA